MTFPHFITRHTAYRRTCHSVATVATASAAWLTQIAQLLLQLRFNYYSCCCSCCCSTSSLIADWVLASSVCQLGHFSNTKWFGLWLGFDLPPANCRLPLAITCNVHSLSAKAASAFALPSFVSRRRRRLLVLVLSCQRQSLVAAAAASVLRPFKRGNYPFCPKTENQK